MVPWAVEIAALLALGAGAPTLPLPPEASVFVVTEYRPVASLAAVPAPLTAALREVIGEAMAARGQPFQAADVIVGAEPRPIRRFVAAGAGGDRWFVLYEHGGLGLHYHLVLFQLAPAPAAPRRTFHCIGLDSRNFLWRLDPRSKKRPPSEGEIQRWIKREVRTGSCDPRGVSHF